MGIAFSIKQVKNGKWHNVKMSQLEGKTIRETLAKFQGIEAVAEFNFDNETFYFCGTEKWLDRMTSKYGSKARRFSDVPAVLEQIASPGILDCCIPMLDDINQIFPDAEHVETSLESSQPVNVVKCSEQGTKKAPSEMR